MRIVKPKTENSLQAVLNRTASSAVPKVAPPQVPADPPTTVRQPPSRTGKRLIGGHFPPSVAKHLKMLAAEEETSVQALLEEALSLLFVKKGKGRLPFD